MDVDVSSIKEIVTNEFNIRMISARWVPKTLAPDHKKSQVNICTKLLQDGGAFLESTATCDETWVHHFTYFVQKSSNRMETYKLSVFSQSKDNTLGGKSYGYCPLRSERFIYRTVSTWLLKITTCLVHWKTFLEANISTAKTKFESAQSWFADETKTFD